MATFSASIERLLANSVVTTMNGARRIPFVMSSSRRDARQNEAAQTRADDIAADLRGEVNRLKGEITDINAGFGANPDVAANLTDNVIQEINDNRQVAELMTDASNARSDNVVLHEPVVMLINPLELTISQPKRKVGVPVESGTRWLHFLDSNNRNNDIMRITISGTTGAIVPEPTAAADSIEAFDCISRYQMWISFYALTQEAMLYNDVLNGGRLTANEFSLVCPSPHLAVPIAFIGQWDAAPEVKVSADNRRSLMYSATFIVDRTEPDLFTVLDQAANL